MMFERAGRTLAEKRWAIKPAYRISTGGPCSHPELTDFSAANHM